MISRRQSSRLLVGGVLASAGIAAGVWRATSAETKTRPVKIGFTWPMAGSEAQWAAGMKAAASLAIEDSNAQAPIPGYTISLLALDEGEAVRGTVDAGRAVTNARALIDDNDVMGILAPRFVEAVKVMSPLMGRSHMAFVSPAVSDPEVTDPTFDRNLRPTSISVFFRTISTDAVQASAMARHFSARLGISTVYGLDDGTPRGVVALSRFRDAAERAGMRWLGRGEIDPTATNFSAVLDPMRVNDPQAVYFGGGPEAVAALGAGLRHWLPHAVVGTSNLACDPLHMTQADIAASAGWYASMPWPHLIVEERTADLRRRLQQATNGAPLDDRMILMYDAALVMIDAIRQVVASGDELLPYRVRNALRSTKLQALQGPIEFTPNGDVTQQTASLFQVADGAEGPLRYVDSYTQLGTEPLQPARRRDL